MAAVSVQEAVKQATEELRLLGVQPGDIVSLAFTNTLEVCHYSVLIATQSCGVNSIAIMPLLGILEIGWRSCNEE